MTNKYKYLYSNTRYLIPNFIIGKSSIVTIVGASKPSIVKSINSNIHEISDDNLFYTDIPGKYNCIVYQIDEVKIVKYKLQYSLVYNFCVKSTKSDLSFKIGDRNYSVVPTDNFTAKAKCYSFDPQDFFNYKFRFFDLIGDDIMVLYSSHDNTLFANISGMVIRIGESSSDYCHIGKLSADKLYIYDFEEPSLSVEKSREHIVGSGDTARSIVCFEITNECSYMIWTPLEYLSFNAYLDGTVLKLINQYKFVPAKMQSAISNGSQNEIYKVSVDTMTNTVKEIKPSPNSTTPDLDDHVRNLTYNSSIFGKPESFEGTFEFMIKIHRNIIRNLYEKYLYIDVLDVGIGKCRDVYTYQKYVNRHSIYGVEPNNEFARACTIKNMFNETADSIFKHFKLRHLNHKFHTIIFCNSYNFVTDPYITMKECTEFLNDGGRIIMVYMNNDKVVTVKNKYYEIRKGEPNPDLPENHVLKNKQNFIQVFTETTLVPPHYENQISESDILDAVEKVNKDLGNQIIEVIDKKSLVHERSSWLSPESKLFNSMFYYCVVGKKCAVDKVIIAVDTDTTTLRDYINYLRKKNTYCNGINIISYKSTIDSENLFLHQAIDGISEKNSITVIIVDSLEKYNKLSEMLKSQKKSYDTIINIQTPAELEYASNYQTDVLKFDAERKKIFNTNPTHSKFGFANT